MKITDVPNISILDYLSKINFTKQISCNYSFAHTIDLTQIIVWEHSQPGHSTLTANVGCPS